MDLIPSKFYLDDIFDDFLTTKKGNDMKCDIYEKDNKYYIEMDVPGFEKKDIKINVDNGYLNISVEKENTEENEDKSYIRRERSFKKYSRSFYVGNIDESLVDASFENGILKIEVPKEEKENNQKYIEIK